MNALQVETYILCIHDLDFFFSRRVIQTARPIGNQVHSLLRYRRRSGIYLCGRRL